MSPIVTARARALLGLALAAGLAAPALAETRIDVIASSAKVQTLQAVVPIDDLNLASVAGRAMLNHRIAFAAQDVCGKDQLYSLGARSDYLRCRSDAISDARAQIEQRIANHSSNAARVSGG